MEVITNPLAKRPIMPPKWVLASFARGFTLKIPTPGKRIARAKKVRDRHPAAA
jgi:hypothetical protein